MRLLFVLAFWLAFSACTSQKAELKAGIWRGVIEMQGQQLPFNFEVVKMGSRYNVHLKNGGEKLLLDEVNLIGDTVSIVLHIFDAQLRAKMEGETLTGYNFKNFERDYRRPFRAT